MLKKLSLFRHNSNHSELPNSWRTNEPLQTIEAGDGVKFAYADPPYLGCGKKLYASYHDRAADWDDPQTHADLAFRMNDRFDGWALSMHEPSLRALLPIMPDGARVAAWVKPFCSFKPGVNPAHAWEPVVYKAVKRGRECDTVRDWVSANITLKRGLPGAKPMAFSIWLFRLLGAMPGDEFLDMFPGTGAVSAAWDAYRGRSSVQDGLFESQSNWRTK